MMVMRYLSLFIMNWTLETSKTWEYSKAGLTHVVMRRDYSYHKSATTNITIC